MGFAERDHDYSGDCIGDHNALYREAAALADVSAAGRDSRRFADAMDNLGRTRIRPLISTCSAVRA